MPSVRLRPSPVNVPESPGIDTSMQIVIFAALVAVVVADTAYPAPYPAYSSKAPSYDYPARPYTFAYDVKDDPSYNDYGHQEGTDGKITSGSYKVLLPDGRTQTVTYKVDDYSGYVADVKTSGAYSKPGYKATY